MASSEVDRLIRIIESEAPLHKQLLEALVTRVKKDGVSLSGTMEDEAIKVSKNNAMEIFKKYASKITDGSITPDEQNELNAAELTYYQAILSMTDSLEGDEKDFQKHLIQQIINKMSSSAAAPEPDSSPVPGNDESNVSSFASANSSSNTSSVAPANDESNSSSVAPVPEPESNAESNTSSVAPVPEPESNAESNTSSVAPVPEPESNAESNASSVAPVPEPESNDESNASPSPAPAPAPEPESNAESNASSVAPANAESNASSVDTSTSSQKGGSKKGRSVTPIGKRMGISLKKSPKKTKTSKKSKISKKSRKSKA